MLQIGATGQVLALMVLEQTGRAHRILRRCKVKYPTFITHINADIHIDASGWGWFIPLHDGTTSVGMVQNQDLASAKKREHGFTSTKDFYLSSLDLIPGIKKLCENGDKGTLVSNIKSASDWSYSASHYAFPYARIVGDAGCFIDPFFSSGVHLAILGGFSAAVTIAAAIRGDCDENTAASWHSKKVTESYTRFFLAVNSTLKQIWSQDAPVINDIDEEGFQRAFDLFRPGKTFIQIQYY
jgi:flavine halogenase